MKILQVNCVYREGSTGKIVFDIHNGLEKRGIESVVCYGRGKTDYAKEENVYKTCSELYADINHAISRVTGVMYGGCSLSTKKLFDVIKKENPDIVHLHCINGYFVNIYSLLKWLGKNKIKTLITMHAEFMYTGGCGYAFECEKWKNEFGCGACPRLKSETGSLFFDNTNLMWKKMKTAFDSFGNNLIVSSVSPWLMNRAKESSILRNKVNRVVLNGTDTENVFTKRQVASIKKELGIESEKIILHVTPCFSLDESHNKGGYFVRELAKRMVNSGVKFVIVGGDKVENEEFPENMLFVGRVNDQVKLAEFYSMADVTLLTSKRETFSMICAESLACGTPIVGFKAGAPEVIAIEEFSDFVEYGDLDALENAVENRLSIPKSESIEKQAKEKYSRESMVEGYIRLYEELMRGEPDGK